MIRRFMTGEPRVVIVGGARDHPAQIDDDDVSRRAVAAIWNAGRPALRDLGARGVRRHRAGPLRHDVLARLPQHHRRRCWWRRSRPTSTTPRCSSTPATSGRWPTWPRWSEVDIYRRRRGQAAVLRLLHPRPRDAGAPPARRTSRRASAPCKGKAGPAYDEEIDALLLHRLKCNTYAMFKKLLDGLEEKGVAGRRATRDRYLAEIAKMTCEAGGTCAFIGTGNTDKVVLHALGLRAARGRPPDQGRRATTWSAAVDGALLDAVRNRREERSASALVRANLKNAHARLERGGRQHELGAALPLHRGLRGRARHARRRWPRISDETPFLIDISPIRDKSFFTLAVEKQAGAHSGLDSTVKHLLAIGPAGGRAHARGPVVASACATPRTRTTASCYKTALRPDERHRGGEGQLHATARSSSARA